ncbi:MULTISPECIES: hypothetical protein [Actinosynnema]|uniref:hypothetical protein n=1 Tax=Actinosynnema TaxID=40566 RepID=UPI0020A4DBC5|nr:hypothetical protein [Actinosynnema pretiosum]MCP2094508.1 hypothetical protein [Actinosynnema pretiosum]
MTAFRVDPVPAEEVRRSADGVWWAGLVDGLGFFVLLVLVPAAVGVAVGALSGGTWFRGGRLARWGVRVGSGALAFLVTAWVLGWVRVVVAGLAGFPG